MITFNREEIFVEDTNKKVGHMRCDFADGTIANTWFPKSNKETKEQLQEIQDVVNQVMFKQITSFDEVVRLCNGNGYDKQTNLFFTEGSFNYWLHLIPVMGEYNYYIHVFAK